MIRRLWARWKRLEKQTCVWQSTRSASGCGNIPDCLAGPLTAVSATILILSSNMCRKFTASFHLVTKEHSAPGFPPSSVHRLLPRLSYLFRRVLKLMSYVEWDRSSYQACHWPWGFFSFSEIRQINMRNLAVTSMYCKNLPRGERIVPQSTAEKELLIQSDFYLHNVCRPLYSPTCRYICMTLGCSGRWHRCYSCQAPPHTRPHLEKEETEREWLDNEAEMFHMMVSLQEHKIQIRVIDPSTWLCYIWPLS